MKIVFDIEPMSQLRPRFTYKGYVHAYDPPKVARYKRMLNGIAAKKMAERGKKPLTGPLEVRMIFYRPIQTSLSKKEHAKRAIGEQLPDVKPDTDNYVKAMWDAMNGVVWEDDKQITDFSAKKRYSEHPRIELEVLTLS